MDFSSSQIVLVIVLSLIGALGIIAAIRFSETRPVVFMPALVGGIPVVAAVWALGVPPWQYEYAAVVSVITLSWTIGFVITVATGAFQSYIDELDSM